MEWKEQVGLGASAGVCIPAFHRLLQVRNDMCNVAGSPSAFQKRRDGSSVFSTSMSTGPCTERYTMDRFHRNGSVP